MSITGARRQLGFTLVELLLAVTLLSLLLALAYGGLSAAIRSADKGQQVLEESSRLRITHQFIRRQLNRMMPLPYTLSERVGDERVIFEGNDLRVQFVGPMPGYLGNAGPQVQAIEVVDGETGVDLVFVHAPLDFFEQQLLYDQDPVVLLKNLQGVRFEFLAEGEPGQPREWTSDWAEVDELPLAVRLEIDFQEESKVSWPVLAASVRLDPAAAGFAGNMGDYGSVIQDMIRRGQENRDED